MSFGKPGGANRDRTGDLLLAKQALSQLSYGPLGPLAFPERRVSVGVGSVVGLGGLEPPTPRLSSVCSNQLSYRPLRTFKRSLSLSDPTYWLRSLKTE